MRIKEYVCLLASAQGLDERKGNDNIMYFNVETI